MMTDTTEIRCPNCGQRMVLHNTDTAEFTCVNCKTTHLIKDAVIRPQNIVLTEKDIVDIWKNPCNYPPAIVFAMCRMLDTLPVKNWPEEIQMQYVKYKKSQRRGRVIVCVLLLLFWSFVLMEVLR